MQQFISAILIMLMNLTPSNKDVEDSKAREKRMGTIANAIGVASYRATCSGKWDLEGCVPLFKGTKKELAVGLVTLGFWESRFALNVHKNECAKYECDPIIIRTKHGERLVHRARTNWQMQYDKGIAEEWPHMLGTSQEATNLAAWAATKKWSRCWPSSVERAFACYAGIAKARWEDGVWKKQAYVRANFYRHKMSIFPTIETE